MTYRPKSVEDICRIVVENEHINLRGGGTKRALVMNGDVLDMSELSGIIDYQPDEYVFTAYTGTPLTVIKETLLQKGQFLPFDPLFIDSGATIGGTIAANSCGSGRFRYGSIRDYILRIGIVDGEGRAFKGGEKVVKNAAGFDLPKFFVGSRGRFGVITEASFKVFPLPPASLLLFADCMSLQTAHEALLLLSRSSLDIHALDLKSLSSATYQLLIRISGLSKALPERSERLSNLLKENMPGLTGISNIAKQDNPSAWKKATTIAPASNKEWLFQVATTLQTFLKLEEEQTIKDCKRRYISGANLLFIYTVEPDRLKQNLQRLSLPFLIIDGPEPIQQQRSESAMPMYSRLKQVFDPNNRFGDF